MKKTISLLLALTMVAALFAGCSGNTNTNETTIEATTDVTTEVTTEAVSYADALDVLNTLFNAYTSTVPEDQQFAVAGGDMEHSVMGAPGVFSLTPAENLTSSLNVDASIVPQIDDAASLMHMMNSNIFTAGVYHVTEGTDLNAFTSTLASGIKGTHFVCGAPEQLIIMTIGGEYVLAMYGSGDLIPAYKDVAVATLTGAELVVDDPIA